MSIEVKFPKFYIYTVDGILNEEGEPKKFSIPTLSRDIEDDFELDSVANSAALFFFVDNKEYQDPEKWPLIFKFVSHTKTIKEVKMSLDFAPSFSSNIKPPVKEEIKKVVRRRKTTKKEEEI